MESAIFRTGGKQYRASEGDVLRVPKLSGGKGDAVEFGEVLLLGGETPKVGKPLVTGAKVKAEIVEHGREAKIVVFKIKRRKKYRRKAGHRQDYTAVRITGIEG